MMKNIIIGVLVVVLVIAGILLFRGGGSIGPEGDKHDDIKVDITTEEETGETSSGTSGQSSIGQPPALPN